ncbi:LytR/AlgR family response regulator transcription factor [Aquimarina megaterium]|uniref:LytR/AlgR family response regulator transcription factor n=1 Tax=Aquimarina megaterium TaxID=1443666 RepID=UPI00046E6F31|nr:response regulator transcription factor [Aquimarina megaterium]
MITYIIIDDETASHDIIEDYSSNLPYLSLQKHCYNAFEAIEYLNQHQVDLVFLDINMPKLTGFDFLKTLSNPPKIIVTTAYKEFALEGYELNIDDYLLKPFSFQRFVTAIQKVQGTLSLHSQNVKNIDDSSIFLKDNKKHYQVKLKDLLFLEAYGNYVKVYLEHQMIITHQTLSSFEEILSKKDFIKVHKSFIIAKNKIELIEGNRITIKDHKIPVGKIYKPNINNLLS